MRPKRHSPEWLCAIVFLLRRSLRRALNFNDSLPVVVVATGRSYTVFIVYSVFWAESLFPLACCVAVYWAFLLTVVGKSLVPLVKVYRNHLSLQFCQLDSFRNYFVITWKFDPMWLNF